MKYLAMVVLFLCVVGSPVYAQSESNQESMEQQMELEVGDTATTPSVMAEPIEYVLPYPGILVDHPLFFLKKIRDSILESLIADPLRKTEFYTLQADKYTAMLPLLVEQQKLARVAEVTVQVEESRNKALTTLSTLRQESREVPSYLIDRLENAMKKHAEVMGSIGTSATDAAVGESMTQAVSAVDADIAELQALK